MAQDQKQKSQHPGRTPAQRRVLDIIGCGNSSPIMSNKTRDTLLSSGLIEEAGEITIGRGIMAVRVKEYQMPISVHMAWCYAMSAMVTPDDLANDLAIGQ